MVTLLLFRHAKSSWAQPGLADFDRPLSPRGKRAAPLVGRYMAQENLVPEIVVCSTAVRARETLELAASEWQKKPEIGYEDGLYHAGPSALYAAVKALGPECSRAMLVGHNPGMHQFAAGLCGDGDGQALRRMAAKFPTAALAVIDMDAPWAGVASGAGTLRSFVVPRDLT